MESGAAISFKISGKILKLFLVGVENFPLLHKWRVLYPGPG